MLYNVAQTAMRGNHEMRAQDTNHIGHKKSLERVHGKGLGLGHIPTNQCVKPHQRESQVSLGWNPWQNLACRTAKWMATKT